MQVYTKRQIIEFGIKDSEETWRESFPEDEVDEAIERIISEMCKKSDLSILKKFRKNTKLMLCLYGPSMFYIKYQN